MIGSSDSDASGDIKKQNQVERYLFGLNDNSK